MRLWWRKTEPVAPPVDIDAIKAQLRGEVTKEVVAEMSRALLTNSPYPSLTAPVAPPIPAYAFDNPIYFSTPTTPTKRPGSVVNTTTLRQLAENYDILRDCILHLKREVSNVPIRVTLKEGAPDNARTQRQIKDATEFFKTTGGLGGRGKTRRDFEMIVIEDLLIIGATALFLHPTLGGGIYEAIPLDASTIRPRVDGYGWAIDGKEYEQWIQGRQSGLYSANEMIYSGLYPRSNTPFYSSSVEWLVMVINAALRADDWNLKWLTDGNISNELISLPETWSPDQIMRFSEFWDALLAGESSARQKTKFVPGGTKLVNSHSRKDQDFQEYELWLMRRTCSIMGVSPASIGFAGEQYKVSQEASMDASGKFGAGTVLDFRKQLYDDLLERQGYDDVEVSNVTEEQSESPGDRATRVTVLVAGAIMTPNEARELEGLDPVEGGDKLLISANLHPIDQPVVDPAADPKVEPLSAETTRALAMWERKALRRVREGLSLEFDFVSESIPAETMQTLRARLAECATPDDVRRAFREGENHA